MDNFDLIKQMKITEESASPVKKQANSKPKKILSIAHIIIWLFLILNIAIYSTVVLRHVAFRPYPVAKFYLSSSLFTTMFYVTPIGKTFGIDSPIVIPFKYVKDSLYQAGIKHIPKNDAEREMWWYALQYRPFEIFYTDIINDYSDGVISENNVNYNYLIHFTDEIYKNTKGLGKKIFKR